jgi:hypothetical protein
MFQRFLPIDWDDRSRGRYDSGAGPRTSDDESLPSESAGQENPPAFRPLKDEEES